MLHINSKILLLATLAPLAAVAAEPQTGSGETDGYRLVWQELFDGDELNLLRWDMEVNGDGGGNNELQYYTDRTENVRVGDDGEGNGCLILTARRENYMGKNFTSGRVISKNRIAFKHGKLEASIKLPKTGNGLWPAFWMMGNDYDEVGWPSCGETDILEMGNANGISKGTQERYFNGAMHWGSHWSKHAQHAQDQTKSYSLQDGKFHLFTVTWDENEVRMYVDLDKMPVQVPYFRMTIPTEEPENEWHPGNYFHKENFILFNVAVGGDFTGIHNPQAITALNEENGNEASMMVNYVKIYQKGDDSESLYAIDPGDTAGVTDVQMADTTPALRLVGDSLMADRECSVRISDMGGATVYESAKLSSNHSLSSLAKGFYIVSASDCAHNTSTLKICY